MTHKVTISSITLRGVEPQFFNTLATKAAAQDYANEFRKLAAQAGVLIRVDFELSEVCTDFSDRRVRS